jgi:hypothetical protein
MNAALEVVTPPNNDAADPVYAVNKNVLSLYMSPTAIQNSKQNCWATITAVLLPDPAGPVRNISSWSRPPLAFNLLTKSFISVVLGHPMLYCRDKYKVVSGLFPSFIKPRRNVHAIISYAMYCFSSSCVFSSFATFLAISSKVGTYNWLLFVVLLRDCMGEFISLSYISL